VYWLSRILADGPGAIDCLEKNSSSKWTVWTVASHVGSKRYLLKAKFHYASWFGASSNQIA